jgi:hypothetical protein
MSIEPDYRRLSYSHPSFGEPVPLLDRNGRFVNPYRPPVFVPNDMTQGSEERADALIAAGALQPSVVLYADRADGVEDAIQTAAQLEPGGITVAFYFQPRQILVRIALGGRALLITCDCYRKNGAGDLYLFRAGVSNAEAAGLVANGRIAISFFPNQESSITVDDWAGTSFGNNPAGNTHAQLTCTISSKQMRDITRAVTHEYTGLLHRLPFQMYCPGDPLVLWFNEGQIALRLTYTTNVDRSGNMSIQSEATWGNWKGQYPGEEEIKWSDQQFVLRTAPLPTRRLVSPAWKINLVSEHKANAPDLAITIDLHKSPSLTFTTTVNGVGPEPIVFDLLSPLPYRYDRDEPPVLLERYRLIENWIKANELNEPTRLQNIFA